MKFSTAINTPLILTKRFAMWFLLAIILLGCSNQSNLKSDLEKNFSTRIPVADMNKSLQLEVDGDESSFRSYEEIELTIHNTSPYRLSFENNSHIQLLSSLDNLQWVEVKNGITYSGNLKLSPAGTILLDTRSTWVKPILDQSGIKIDKEVPLRIVIIGEIIESENRTGEKVAAYVDVVLKPYK